MIRAGGEAGPVDLAALHPRLGVVLVAFVDAGEEASPEEAVAAFRTMLEEIGFAGRFPGRLNVAAITLGPNRRARLAEAIRAAAGDGPESPAADDWIGWLALRLAEPLPTPDLPRLVAPHRADEPRPRGDARLAAPRERLVPPEGVPARKRRFLFFTALAILVLAPVLAAIYLRGDIIRQFVGG
jgi:hypothetical protein